MENQSTYVEIRHQIKELKMLLFLVCQKNSNVVGVIDAFAFGVTRT
jgi:hypothetical protein